MKNFILFATLLAIAFIRTGELNLNVLAIQAAILLFDWIFINYLSTEIVQLYDKLTFFKNEGLKMAFFWAGCVFPAIVFLWKLSEGEFIEALMSLSLTAGFFVLFKMGEYYDE